MPELLRLHNPLSPGDVTVMTAAVKALHDSHPGRFVTDYKGTASELFHHNPYITPLRDGRVREIKMEYPLINFSNQRPRHFIEGYVDFLMDTLGVDITLSEFRPDIYVSDQERRWTGQVHSLVGQSIPYWIIVAGGKYDFTNKWWDHLRFQQVVRHFEGKICFIRVGADGHFHPPLKGVIDLRGKTDIRQLVRLVYHSQGVVCPITFLMHLAAGVPSPETSPAKRACVAINGGREPVQWEAYPWHQFIHTVGSLECCMEGGCWKSRTVPLGDGDDKDKPENLCQSPVKREGLLTIPKCMDMITADEVCRRIYLYFEGGERPFLTKQQYEATLPHLS